MTEAPEAAEATVLPLVRCARSLSSSPSLKRVQVTAPARVLTESELAALFEPFGGRERYEAAVAQRLAMVVASDSLDYQQPRAGTPFRLVHPRQYGAMLRRREALDKVRQQACGCATLPAIHVPDRGLSPL